MSVLPKKDHLVAQIIDANLDRAREGLRVIEEWCRFTVNNRDIVITLKDWRQILGTHHLNKYKFARNIYADKGLGLKHAAQGLRLSTQEVLSANCARVQEALRVLEEFSRIENPSLAENASEIRYKLYELEAKLLRKSAYNQRKERLQACKLCLITSPQKDLINKVEAALDGGIKMLQYRNKKASNLDKFNEAKKLSDLCKKYNSLFIINDHIDIALAVEADGIHLGQEDMPTKVARGIIGSELLIGRSTNNIHQLKKAEEEGCDYLGFGPINNSTTKPELKALGLDSLKEANRISKIPLFAIGGINSSNIQSIISSGTEHIAIISAIMGSKNPEQTSLELIKAFL